MSSASLSDAGVVLLEATLPSPEANLALDEALLEGCDAGSMPSTLRFWEPGEVFVVVGYSNVAAREVRVEACRRAGVPILRRCSGGGTVLQMPGVLNYNLVLSIPQTGPFSTLAGTNREVMERIREALSTLPELAGRLSVRGVTDLCLGELKCLGNAQRRKQSAFLFHGSFLIHAPLHLLEELLQTPSTQPQYRENRSHLDFCCNVGVEAGVVKSLITKAFAAQGSALSLPCSRVAELVSEKYGRAEWNER